MGIEPISFDWKSNIIAIRPMVHNVRYGNRTHITALKGLCHRPIRPTGLAGMRRFCLFVYLITYFVYTEL